MKRLTAVAAVLAALLVAIAALAGVATGKEKPKGVVELQFLALSDWHGQLDPLNIGGVNIGGAAAIATYWAQHRAANPNTLEFTAGDSYGATPPVSNFFDEEPAVRAERMLGIDADTFGNHNWDRGNAHLQRMINLAGSTDPSVQGEPFGYVASNLKNLDANLSGVTDTMWFRVADLNIAVIAAVNEEAPTLVKPDNLGTIEITDSAQAINAAVEQARKHGKVKADIVLVLTHKGVRGFNPDGSPFGELIDLANQVQGVDVIFGDHTDIQWSGTINDALVLEARSKGVSYSRTRLTWVPKVGVTDKTTQFITPIASAVPADAAVQALINGYKSQLQPILGTVIGNSNVAVPRADSCSQSAGRTCESKVGNVTTDALRAAYGTDFAITNSGGLRADLTCPGAGSGGFCPTAITPPPFPITRGSVLGVLPFGNVSVTLSVTGADVKAFLENGISRMPGVDGRFPQVSGLCFTYDISAPVGSRVTSIVRQAANGSCTPEPVQLAGNYTLATNDFVAAGGDGYPVVMPRATTRNIMDADVADYVRANALLAPTLQGRIKCTTSGATACPVLNNP